MGLDSRIPGTCLWAHSLTRFALLYSLGVCLRTLLGGCSVTFASYLVLGGDLVGHLLPLLAGGGGGAWVPHHGVACLLHAGLAHYLPFPSRFRQGHCAAIFMPALHFLPCLPYLFRPFICLAQQGEFVALPLIITRLAHMPFASRALALPSPSLMERRRRSRPRFAPVYPRLPCPRALHPTPSAALVGRWAGAGQGRSAAHSSQQPHMPAWLVSRDRHGLRPHRPCPQFAALLDSALLCAC